jgi:hypothetical protein
MLDGLGVRLRKTKRSDWPSFLFFGGDQIYADEIGDKTADALLRGRIASRIPGENGAWAGRFGKRFTDLPQNVHSLKEPLDKLIKLYREHGKLSQFPGLRRENWKRLASIEDEILKLQNGTGWYRPLRSYLDRNPPIEGVARDCFRD